MKRVQEHVSGRKAEFAAHPIFRRMASGEPLDGAHVEEGLTFFVMTFHDLLDLLEARMIDPELRRIVAHHVGEERGHDRWFLEDMGTFGIRLPTVPELFGDEHGVTREASYALIAEAYRAQDDFTRVGLVLALEATGHVFFDRASEYGPWQRMPRKLKFFSRHHLDVEEAHRLFEQKMVDYLAAIPLDDTVRTRTLACVDRAFDAFHRMFDGMENRRLKAGAA